MTRPREKNTHYDFFKFYIIDFLVISINFFNLGINLFQVKLASHPIGVFPVSFCGA